MQYVD